MMNREDLRRLNALETTRMNLMKLFKRQPDREYQPVRKAVDEMLREIEVNDISSPGIIDMSESAVLKRTLGALLIALGGPDSERASGEPFKTIINDACEAIRANKKEKAA